MYTNIYVYIFNAYKVHSIYVPFAPDSGSDFSSAKLLLTAEMCLPLKICWCECTIGSLVLCRAYNSCSFPLITIHMDLLPSGNEFSGVLTLPSHNHFSSAKLTARDAPNQTFRQNEDFGKKGIFVF